MLHTVTTGLCTVVPVPVGNCVGTWFVSFVWRSNGIHTLQRSLSLCRGPRELSARGIAAMSGPDDRPRLAIIDRLIECQDLAGREQGRHLFEPGARSILVAPKSEVLYTLVAQVVHV